MATNIFKVIYDKLSALITAEFSRITGERILFKDEVVGKDFRHDDFINIRPVSDDIITPFVSGETRRYTIELTYYKKNTLISYDNLTSFAEELKDALLSNRCVSTGEWYYLEVLSVSYGADIPDDIKERYWGFTMTITMDRGLYQA